VELTDTQLTFLSTLAWLVLTSVGFTVLVRWSTGDGSWTVLPGLVRGVRGWVDEHAAPGESSRGPRPEAASRITVVHLPDAEPDASAEIEDL
jgi:hypothetical protein